MVVSSKTISRAHSAGLVLLILVVVLAICAGGLLGALVVHVVNHKYWPLLGLLIGIVFVFSILGGAMFGWSNQNRRSRSE